MDHGNMRESSPEPSHGTRLRAELTERHATFAQQIWELFHGTVAQLEDEVHVLRAQNYRLKSALDAATTNHTTLSPAVEILTENSSDSEDETEQIVQPKVEENESPISSKFPPEPEVQTENSSDSEDERELRKKLQSNNVLPDPQDITVIISDPPTEDSSESESNCEVAPKTKRSRSENKSSKKTMFKCSLCNKTFNYKSVLKMHALSHGSNRPFECSECGFSFNVKQHLFRHMKIHNRNRPSACSEDTAAPGSSGSAAEPIPDGEGTSEAENAADPQPPDDNDDDEEDTRKPDPASAPKQSRPIRLVQNNKPSFIKRFQTQVQWRHQHLACPSCEQRFRFQSELQRHIKRSHSPKGAEVSLDKPNQCHICKKSFRDKTYVQEHVRIHTGEKPFTCSVCGKSFTFKKSYNLHMKLHK